MATNVTALGVSGLVVGKSFQLGATPLTIGRSPDASIPLTADAGVSRNHAQLYIQGDAPFVVDLGSSNGTMVNGERLTGPRPLADGDVVAVGPHSFRIQIQLDQPIRPSVPVVGAPICILCGGNQVIALRSVTAAGVSSTVGTSVSIGGAHVLGGGPNLVGGSIGTSRSVTKTDLAKMLAFPYPKPKNEKFIDKGASCAGCFTFVAVGMLLGHMIGESGLIMPTLLALVAGMAITFLVQAINKTRNVQLEAEHNRKQADAQLEYNARRLVYDRSMYCPQCHSVFDPVTGRHNMPEQLAGIL